MPSISNVVLFNKPYGVLSQFTAKNGKACLADFGPFERDLYPVGRLDFDSEGMLILTNDPAIKHALTDPGFDHPKTYFVQVDGRPGADALKKLCEGVLIQGIKTRPAEAAILETEPPLSPRSVPVRIRKSIPTTWITLTITEGRNRQVRHMTAAVGHPTLRLVRVRIGKLEMGPLPPGRHRTLTDGEIRTALPTGY